MIRYFHGGHPGLRPGDMLSPGHQRPGVVGCTICEARSRGDVLPIDPPSQHADRIYITSDREYARYYASLYPRGDLYQVEPIGELVDVGTEDPFPTWAVEAARVLKIYQVSVLLTWSQRLALYRRWKVVDDQRTAEVVT